VGLARIGGDGNYLVIGLICGIENAGGGGGAGAAGAAFFLWAAKTLAIIF